MSLCVSTLLFAQNWQSKDAVRIENVGQGMKFVFTDSTFSVIQKSKISYIVNFPNSSTVQIGFMWDGSTSKVVNVRYNTLTQPTSSSAKGLSAILNSWL